MKKILTFILLCASFLHSQEVRILSFDGGGVRGVASLEILNGLEKSTQVVFHESFDVFAGTSTGSIIAVALAMGIPVKEMIKDYIDLSSKVFSNGKFLTLFQPKYDREELKKALLHIFESRGYSENSCLNDLPKKVVIPTVCLDDPKTGRWKMAVRENFSLEGGKIKIVDVILESTAAPTYFSSYKNYIDGGVAMNDPSLAAYISAYHPLSIEKNGVMLLSIGTGYVKKHIEGGENWGELQWISPVALDSDAGSVPLLSMVMDVEEQIPAQLCSILIPNSYRKVDISFSDEIALDDYSNITKLIAETQNFLSTHKSYWEDVCTWLRPRLSCEKKE